MTSKRTLMSSGFFRKRPTHIIEPLFTVSARKHGRGRVLFACSKDSQFIASTGTSKVVHIHRAVHRRFSRSNFPGYALHRQITPPGSGICRALEWNYLDDKLAIIQESSSILVLWHTSRPVGHPGEQIKICGHKEHLNFIRFSLTNDSLAVGTTRGTIYMYNCIDRNNILIRHHKNSKGKVIDGVWSKYGNRFAWVTEDKHLHCCDAQGVILLHTTLKSSPMPTLITFGTLRSDSLNDCMLCIQFSSGKNGTTLLNEVDGNDIHNTTNTTATTTTTTTTTTTNNNNSSNNNSNNNINQSNNTTTIPIIIPPLLLFNTDTTNNNSRGIDLEFRPEYGVPIQHCWDGKGTLLVGFANGYVCGLICDFKNIFVEKFCVQIDTNMHCLSYSSELSTIACCSIGHVHLVRHDAQEEEEEEEKEQVEEVKVKENKEKDGKNKNNNDADRRKKKKKTQNMQDNILPYRFRHTDTSTTADLPGKVSNSPDLDSVQFTTDDTGLISISDASGAIYTYNIKFLGKKKTRIFASQTFRFGKNLLTTGKVGKLIRMLSAPLNIYYLILLLILGFMFVVYSTAYMMESTFINFFRIVLGISSFV